MEYWLVNLRTKELTKFEPDSDFWDGDWKLKTPFADANYIDLHAFRIWPEQKVSEDMAWDHDLCRDGMIVGLYYNSEAVTREQAEAFIKELSGRQDVAHTYYHPLVEVPWQTTEPKKSLTLQP